MGFRRGSTPGGGSSAPGSSSGPEPGKRSRATQLRSRGRAPAPIDVPAAAARGVEGDGGALPFGEQLQQAFGHHDLTGVRAHVGGAAADASAAIGARAYATGGDIAFASSPDLHTAAHEAAHVVQQRGGVHLAGGVGEAGDPYERHADAVADAVVRGESAESVLDQHAGRGSAGGPAVQRTPEPLADLQAAIEAVATGPALTPTLHAIAAVAHPSGRAEYSIPIGDTAHTVRGSDLTHLRTIAQRRQAALRGSRTPAQIDQLIADIVAAISQNESHGAAVAPPSRLHTSPVETRPGASTAYLPASYASSTQMIAPHAIGVLRQHADYATEHGLDADELNDASSIANAAGRIWDQIVTDIADAHFARDQALARFTPDEMARMQLFRQFRQLLTDGAHGERFRQAQRGTEALYPDAVATMADYQAELAQLQAGATPTPAAPTGPTATAPAAPTGPTATAPAAPTATATTPAGDPADLELAQQALAIDHRLGSALARYHPGVRPRDWARRTTAQKEAWLNGQVVPLHRALGNPAADLVTRDLQDNPIVHQLQMRPSDVRAYLDSGDLHRFREDRAAYTRAALRHSTESTAAPGAAPRTLDAAVGEATEAGGGHDLSRVEFDAWIRDYIHHHPTANDEAVVRAAATHNGSRSGYADHILGFYRPIAATHAAPAPAPTGAEPAPAPTGAEPAPAPTGAAPAHPPVQGAGMSAAASESPDVPAIAARGVEGSGGALPFGDRIQAAFGHHDLGGVRAHVGGAAADASAAIGARAYATGGDVAFASSPDLHTAAHEAAHVVQQRGGVHLAGGVGREGDLYERHADAVADAVVRGESAESVLDQHAGRGSAGGPAVQLRTVTEQDAPAQTTLEALIGRSDTPHLQLIADALAHTLGTEHAMDVNEPIDFTYDADVYHLMVPRGTVPHFVDLVAQRRAALARPGHAGAHGTGGAAPLDSFGRDALAGLIASAAGDVGEEQQLEIEVHVPIEVIAIAGHLELTVGHDASGFRVLVRPQLGLGLATEGRGHADLLTGMTVEVHGHDAQTAASLLALALEHEVRAMATQPPPMFVCVALAAASIEFPFAIGGAVAADLIARGYNYATTGHASDPFWLWLADAMFGQSHTALVRRSMTSSDSVETIDEIDAEAGTSGEGEHHHEGARHEGSDADVGGTFGGGHHWRVDGARGSTPDPDGALPHEGTVEREYNTIDFSVEAENDGFGIEVTVHLPMADDATGGTPPPAHADIKIMGHVETTAGGRMLAVETIALAAQRLSRAIAAHSDAAHATAAVALLDGNSSAIASQMRAAIVARATGAAMPARVGAELEIALDWNTHTGLHPQLTVTVKLTDGFEGHGLGEGASVAHSLVIGTWQFTG